MPDMVEALQTFYEQQCAGLQSALAASRAEAGALRAALTDTVAALEAIEWIPSRNMKGTLTNFCPVCHGTPSIYRSNPKTSRPDGHWAETVPWPNGCPLAAVLDQARAALAALGQEVVE